MFGFTDEAHDVFFKTLMQSVKEANKCNSIKSSSWKNPLLYKTTLCDHWRIRGCCRFGVSCWYAHGDSELRFVPRLNQLPSAEYIHQYLAYLGLPRDMVDKIIKQAYETAGLQPEESWSPPTLLTPTRSSQLPFGRSASCNATPVKEDVSFVAPEPADALKLVRARRDLFCSSITSDSNEWELLRRMVDQSVQSQCAHPDGQFQKSFKMFGDSYALKNIFD